jgi:hypothetical protein
MRECALKAQVKEIIDMAVVTLKKTQIMEDQNVLAFFTILEEQVLDCEVREYLKLWCQEELEKLHHCLQLSSTMAAFTAMPPQVTPSTLVAMTSCPCTIIPLPTMTSAPP